MIPPVAQQQLNTIDTREHRAARIHAVENGGECSDRSHRSQCSEREQSEHREQSAGIFTSKPMNQWLDEAKDRSAPTQLCGDFWQQGELALFFGSTGDGKTVLGMQLANDIATGRTTTGFALGTSACVVNYFDFELSDAQHVSRYSDGDGNIFKFGDNLNRIEMDLTNYGRVSDLANWDNILLDEIERIILESKAKINLFDNLTWLSRETDKGKFALPLMQKLSVLKKQHELSILAMAHTPKRDETRPIVLNDLAGSRILANLADSVFAIGKSAHDSGLRYLKQLKARSADVRYSTENVATCLFGKNDNFLGFKHIGEQSEREHLRALEDGEYARLCREAKDLHKAGLTQREISTKLEISVSTVNKYIHRPNSSNSPNGANSISEYEQPRTPSNAGEHFKPVFADPERQREWDAWEAKQ